MDQDEPKAGSSSPAAIIDINDNDDWDDESEDIELDVEEHDLFLKDNYIKSDAADLLPYRVNSSPTNFIRQDSFLRSQTTRNSKAANNSDHSSKNSYETLQLEEASIHIPKSPTQSSTVYQTPNFERFAGSLAPTSLASIVASFVIVVVILLVTILPMMLPQSSSSISDDENDSMMMVTNDNVIKQQDIKNKSISADVQTALFSHADARCKCICPPQSAKDDQSPIPTQRRLYVGNTSPDQCKCNNIMQSHLADIKIPLKTFCSRCECRFQSRNTATIRRNIIFFIIILSGMCFYMLVQYLLKYYRVNRRNLPRRFRWLSHQLIESV